jgi:ADP-ribose pyrophosphatase YjhB (NUDIX family)
VEKTDWRGFVIGGIEDGEDPIETGKREIAEETGYTSAKFVRALGGIVHAQFFHAVKNENRWAHFHPLYFKLENGEKNETSDKEQEIHDVHWIPGKDLEEFLGWVTDMRLIWLRAYTPEAFLGGSALHPSSRVAEDGFLVNSGKFDGLKIEESKKEITEFVKGKIVTTYKLRDWIFSRQRYWGEPIPMIFCEHCKREKPETEGWVPVPEKDLPVELPEVKNYLPTDTGESPLASISEWVNTKCPVCGSPAKRETDTMPNWAGSHGIS